jgi:cellulose synthase/poly-beta-1,6-N-acetylglucosamine synthase-like glycosyltransferase
VNFRRLQRVPNIKVVSELPSISIIIPARDEMHNLKVILPSLIDLHYPGKSEILVVDDHSGDDTGRIAKSFGVQVLNLDHELPQGWKGKPYACHQGALIARGDWFLFTDADTVHTKDGISRVVLHAEQENLDGLSLFIKQQAVSWIDGTALDAAFAGLFAGWSASNHMLNGQFILIRRGVYFASGGFESVRNEVLEDVALGNLLDSYGYRLQVLKGDDVARVHMYGNQKQMFLGLSRLGAGSLQWEGIWAGLTALHVTALMSPLISLLGVIMGRLRWFWFPVTWSMASLSLFPWSRRSGASNRALFAPLGALVVLVAALYGLINRLFRRGVLWKGRKV